jgi:hypothetical protein
MIRRLLVPLALVASGWLAACGGGSGSGGGADPAAAVPPGVPFYAEVVLRPSGDARDGALAAAGKILHTSDPEAKIRSLLQQAFAADGMKVDFAKDIEPWVGDRAGAWFSLPARAGAHPGGALVLAVRNADLARAKIDELARRNGEKLAPRTSGAHDYEVAPDGTAVAVEGDYAIVGSEGEVKRGMATLDGDGLAKQDRYVKAIEPLQSNRLAQYYVDMKALIDAAARTAPSRHATWGPFEALLSGAIAGGAQAASFSADADRLTLESVVKGGGGLAGPLLALTGLSASPLLGKLPGDAWGALAVPKTGSSLRTVYGTFAGMLGGVAISEQLRREYGIDIEQDVFSWMGDAGMFVRGTSVETVDGALVVEATDQAKATLAFGKLVGLARTRGGLDPQPIKVDGADAAFSMALPQATKPLVVARGNGRVVAAYGTGAAAAGLSAPDTLGGSDTMTLARDALDGTADPTLVVAVAPLLALAESAGASRDPDYQKAKPYLQPFSVIATGSKQDGDTTRTRLAVGLR